MRVTVSLEQRFQRTPDGRIWSVAGTDARFWDAYLDVFDGVRVVARVLDVPRVDDHAVETTAEGVEFARLPYYVGPVAYASRYPLLRRTLRRLAADGDAFLFRIPSPLATQLAAPLLARRAPFGVEVVGNPQDVFAPGVVDHLLRPVFRWLYTGQVRQLCREAAAASYVTEATLQRHFPCRGRSFAISSIRLDAEALAAPPRRPEGPARRLVFVGSLEQLYKGPDVLIEAVALLARQGVAVEITMVGDGRCRPALEAQARQAGVADRVRFAGRVRGGAGVRAELDRADLFVLPSRTEGLPRAVLEAMARGLPCLATPVGGVPELLPPEALVPAGDAAALAARLAAILPDGAWRAAASARNREVARGYSQEVLAPRRREFYRFIREETARRASGAPCA